MNGRGARGLSAPEARLWAQVTATVKPLAPPEPAGPGGLAGARQGPGTGHHPASCHRQGADGPPADQAQPPARKAKGRVPPARLPPAPPALPSPPPLDPHARAGLDGHWERRLARAAIAPEMTIDLHDHTLAQAHARLDHGLARARAMGLQMVLVITGRPRPAPYADRGEGRGSIRANILDWLAAGPHGDMIAAVRQAHPRHGGEGALYLKLRRRAEPRGARPRPRP